MRMQRRGPAYALCLLAACGACRKPPLQRRFIVSSLFQGVAYLVHPPTYGSEPERYGAGGTRSYTVPASGILSTAEPTPFPSNDSYFEQQPDGRLVPLPVVDGGLPDGTSEQGPDTRRIVFHPASGIMEFPGCDVAYESFYVGTAAALNGAPADTGRLEGFARAHPEFCRRGSR